MSNYNAQEVIAALQANGGMYIDDHHRGDRGEIKAQMFGIYKEQGREHAFIGYTSSLFCVNKCYIDEDGKVHLSTWSVGGNVRIDRFKNDVEGAINQFNDDNAKYNSFDKTARISEWHLNQAA